MNKKISRKKFIKDVSIFTVGMFAFSNMLLAAEKGLSKVLNIIPVQNDPKGILNLLKGFKYKIISKKGQSMSDGLTVPDHADGMASFKGKNGKIILVRNHEIGHFKTIEKLLDKNPMQKNKAYINKNKNLMYDPGKNNGPCGGGTTTIIYNPKTQTVETEYLSLAGTLVNCGGGITPWNTWISCEETVDVQGNNLIKNHGYNFEVTPSETIKLNQAVPLKAMGRFRHEAIAIDPTTSIAYQTEDRDDGLIYRFIPNVKKEYVKGGKLQALILENITSNDTRNWGKINFNKNIKYKIDWLNLNEVDNPKDDLRYRAAQKGAAIFARPEGMWYDNNFIYFTCTTGGPKKIGQVWKMNISEQTLEMIFESYNSDVMKKCDNMTIAPWGDVIICEDGKGKDRLIGLRQNGSTYVIAENYLNNSEFAGVNFSPDGSILFVNIYSPTMTIAITGPWKELV
mgnify:FL=1